MILFFIGSNPNPYPKVSKSYSESFQIQGQNDIASRGVTILPFTGFESGSRIEIIIIIINRDI